MSLVSPAQRFSGASPQNKNRPLGRSRLDRWTLGILFRLPHLNLRSGLPCFRCFGWTPTHPTPVNNQAPQRGRLRDWTAVGFSPLASLNAVAFVWQEGKSTSLRHLNQTPAWGHGMPKCPLRRSLSVSCLFAFLRPLNASDFLLSLTILGDWKDQKVGIKRLRHDRKNGLEISRFCSFFVAVFSQKVARFWARFSRFLVFKFRGGCEVLSVFVLRFYPQEFLLWSPGG